MPLSTGKIAFSNMVNKDTAFGKDEFNVTLQLEPEEATLLSSRGVKLRDYQKDEDTPAIPQRQFKTKYALKPSDIVDAEGAPFDFEGRELPRGTLVRIQWPEKPPHPTGGVPTYISKMRILELGESSGEGAFEEGF